MFNKGWFGNLLDEFNFNVKILGLGTILALILALVLDAILNPWGGYIGVFLGPLIIIYMLNGEMKDSAINGGLVGLFTAIIVLILLSITAAATGEGSLILGNEIIAPIALTLEYIVIGVLGGFLGVFIKKWK